MNIRSFSGEFPRKIQCLDPQANPSFEERLNLLENDSIEEQIKKILTGLIESDFPYSDMESASNMILSIMDKTPTKEIWTPRVWCEIAPGKMVQKNFWGWWNDEEDDSFLKGVSNEQALR